MLNSFYIATAVGLYIAAQTDGNWDIISHALVDKSLTSVVATEGIILAGTKNGIWRSTDNGKKWEVANQGLSIPYVRWMAMSSTLSSRIFVGTEPAGIFVSQDSGINWHNRAEVGELRDALGWFLPYSSAAGCIRGFAIAASGPKKARTYAAVEVGGVLVSDDKGDSWHLIEGSDGKPDWNRPLGQMIHPDVHCITVHPRSSDLVTAATGGGLYRSTDGGKNWKLLYDCYIRAVWVDPKDAGHIMAGPADGVARNGRIEESFDGGKTWKLSSDGTSAPWPRHMVERFYPHDDNLFVILSNGELWLRKLSDKAWVRILPQITKVKAVTAAVGLR